MEQQTAAQQLISLGITPPDQSYSRVRLCQYLCEAKIGTKDDRAYQFRLKQVLELEKKFVGKRVKMKSKKKFGTVLYLIWGADLLSGGIRLCIRWDFGKITRVNPLSVLLVTVTSEESSRAIA